jgi:hypothetical protein
MELLICIDALRRASAKRITAVIPYFGYARQDRKPGPRTPISAKLVANLITEAGADRVLTVDLHAGQIQGFFDIPTDNLYAAPVIAARHQGALRRSQPDGGLAGRRRRGARPRARQAHQRTLAIVDKRRERPAKSEVMNIIGDVEGPRCILIDDIVDSGGTLCNAAEALLEQIRRQGSSVAEEPISPTACCRAARSARIPVHFNNHADSPGLKRGGVLNIVRHEIEFWCPSEKIPQFIEVDLTGMDIGDSLHISAIKLPDGLVPVIRSRDFTVATVAAPSAFADAEAKPAAAAGDAATAPAAAGAAAPAAGAAKAGAPAAAAKAAPAKAAPKK